MGEKTTAEGSPEVSGVAALGMPATPATGSEATSQVGGPRPVGRQRRKRGGRHRLVGVRMTDDEHAELVTLAARAGVSVPRFLVESARSPAGGSGPVDRGLLVTMLACRAQLAMVGSNLNQLARWANTERMAPDDAELARVLADVEAAVADAVRVIGEVGER